MSELIPGAMHKIMNAAKDQAANAVQRRWITRLTQPEVYAYCPDRVRNFVEANKPPRGSDMETMRKYWTMLPTVFNKDAEKAWVQNLVRGAKEMTHGQN